MTTVTDVTDVDLTRTMQVAALCLEYPDEALTARLPLLRRAAASLPAAAGRPLGRFLDHLAGCDPGGAARDYVATFDLRRRCCPYLTYYAHGDTRGRGMALLRFASAYRAAGITLVDGELPDHLGVVCEVTARVPGTGLALLREHRAGLELLHMALVEAASPYVDVVAAVRAVLPDPAPRDLARALDLARSGPPGEEVGLEPFAVLDLAGPPRTEAGR